MQASSRLVAKNVLGLVARESKLTNAGDLVSAPPGGSAVLSSPKLNILRKPSAYPAQTVSGLRLSVTRKTVEKFSTVFLLRFRFRLPSFLSAPILSFIMVYLTHNSTMRKPNILKTVAVTTVFSFFCFGFGLWFCVLFGVFREEKSRKQGWRRTNSSVVKLNCWFGR